MYYKGMFRSQQYIACKWPIISWSKSLGLHLSKSKWSRIVLVPLLVLVMIGILAIVGANIFFYFTEDARFRGVAVERNHVYNFGRDYEEIFVESIDSGRVHAVLLTNPDPRGVVFFLPGTHSDVELAYSRVASILDYGYDLMIMEYRGCGKSTGPSSESAFYADSQLLYEELKKKYDEKQIILCGHSLGGVMAARIASLAFPGKTLLVASLYSINKKYENRRPWKYRQYEFPTYKFVEQSNSVIYFICGSEDVLLEQTLLLKKHARESDSLFIIDNANHLDLFLNDRFHEIITEINAN